MTVMQHIHFIVQLTTEQEVGLTAPMDGLNSSRGPGCVTPAPKNNTGSSNNLGGLNENYGL